MYRVIRISEHRDSWYSEKKGPQRGAVPPARCNHERRKCCSEPVDCFYAHGRQSRTVKIVKEMSERKSERERERETVRERGEREKIRSGNEKQSRRKRGHTRMHPNMLYKSYSLPSFMNDQLQFSIEQRIYLLPSTSSLYLNSDKNCSPAGRPVAYKTGHSVKQRYKFFFLFSLILRKLRNRY